MTPYNRPDSIATSRLVLVALSLDEIRALIAGDTQRAGALASLVFPPGWPEDVGAREGLPWHLRYLEVDEAQRAWRVRVIAERLDRLVVGSLSLKGPPNARGDVEIGWGIDEGFRLRGYAIEAARSLAAWVSLQPGATSLNATIADDNVASQRVAAGLGLQRTSETLRDLPLWRRAAIR
jgi:ribosomal-protein-alanine N-acetyltransferase